jgi:glutamine synthetase
VPSSGPQSRRVENRLAGSDVNPYLAIAATLACGYLGMTEKIEPNEPITGSAYDLPFSLHAHIHASIQAMEGSSALRKTLGDEFVSLYCAVKTEEYREFQEIVTPWEREVLMFNV